MKPAVLATIILLALGGLMFIQFRLLVIGARLEKLKFDKQVDLALQEAVRALDEPNPLRDSLVGYLSRAFGGGQEPPPGLAPALDSLLGAQLARLGLNPRFAFAVTDAFDAQVVLHSPRYDPETFGFGRHRIPLGGNVIGGCHCQPVLHLDVQQLFAYLLHELDYLALPSLLLLLVILTGLVLLLHLLGNLRRLDAVKNDFINNLTHELKTPVFSIRLAVRMLEEEPPSPQKRDAFFSLIRRELDRLEALIEKVLELGGLEERRFRLHKEPLDLHQLLEQTLALWRQQHPDSLQIRTALRAARPRIPLNREHFQNLLLNLLDNALKYGAKTVEVGTRDEGGRLLLYLRDDGPGIPPEHQRAVFRKFYRVPQEGGARVKGFGLGLYYVRQIVEAHGGRIRLESRVGEGCTFFIRLPR